GFGVFWIAYIQITVPSARGLDALAVLLIAGALLLACGKLLYYTVRLLVLPGRGASEEAVRGVLESLGATAPDALSSGLWRLAMFGIASAVLAAVTAIAILAMNSIVLPSPATPFTFPPSYVAATPAPVVPLQQGDIMLQSSQLADVAMLTIAAAS